jgi:methionine synthase I (cobalamin-dependent)
VSERLPQPGSGRVFIGDGGLETTMIFDEGFELPCFASFVLLREPRGVEALRRYYRGYIDIAERRGLGFTLDTPTWRANKDWGAKLGYSDDALAEVNCDALALGKEIRPEAESAESPIAVCGTIGPRGDAYHPSATMSPDEAERYHSGQIGTFAETAVDMVSAYTLAYADEAVGIVSAGGRGRGSRLDLVHRRDRRPAPERAARRRGDRAGRRPHRWRRAVLHDQLRSPHPRRAGDRAGRPVAPPPLRGPTERVAQEP